MFHKRPALKVQLMDLRAVTRPGCVTHVQLDSGDYTNGPLKEWIVCGRVSLQSPDRSGISRFSARALEGVTDFEHDSAYIFQLPLVGARLEMVESGWTYIVAHIAGDPDDLRIPSDGTYDPEKLDGAEICESEHYGCKGKPHIVVPQDYYAGPPTKPTVWANLVGRRVEIRIGPEKVEG